MPRPIRILLIEDTEDDIELTRLAFAESKLNSQLSTVSNGSQAIAFLEDPNQSLPDLILLDWKLPKMSGHTLLKKLKSSEFKRIPTVILTTSSNPRDVRAAYDEHANAYLEKPLLLSSLVQLIQNSEIFWFETVTRPG